MYVVWKTRQLSGTGACEFCCCAGMRWAVIPLIVASRRVSGVPRQEHLARLASVRSCCLNSEAVLKEWWRQVDAALRAFSKKEAATLRRSLADGIARIKREGFRWQERRQETGTHSPHSLTSAVRLLGLSWPCQVHEVKAAFRALAKQTHPDVGGRAEVFRAVSDAYQEVLKAVAG